MYLPCQGIEHIYWTWLDTICQIRYNRIYFTFTLHELQYITDYLCHIYIEFIFVFKTDIPHSIVAFILEKRTNKNIYQIFTNHTITIKNK